MDEGDVPLLGGRYRLGSCLGGGGMADVYRAQDTRLDRTVAVKLFRSGTDAAGRERFEEEARLLAGLSHPGLVPVHDASASGDELYLVMQLVEGSTLADLIARGVLPPAEVAGLGRQLSEVLDYVHSNGIVHRDVKPSNVLLSREGRVFLADFGVSRLADAVGRMTASGVIMGTASYMAPEQVRGTDIAYPVDVYALGLVLLECVTGRVEYDGVGAEAAMARLTRPPRVPDHLPEYLASTLRAMLADDPAERPSSVRCADLLGSEVTETIPVVRTEPESPLWPGTEDSTVVGPWPNEESTAQVNAGAATAPNTRMFPPDTTPNGGEDQHERRIPRGWLFVAAGGAVGLVALLFLLLPSSPESEESPPLPPTSGPPGVERLDEDLANLERLVRR
ncbi:serine/threonine-protein kinase [Parasphingorhabdus pacifica]